MKTFTQFLNESSSKAFEKAYDEHHNDITSTYGDDITHMNATIGVDSKRGWIESKVHLKNKKIMHVSTKYDPKTGVVENHVHKEWVSK